MNGNEDKRARAGQPVQQGGGAASGDAPEMPRVPVKFIAIYAAAWTGVWMALLPPVLVGLTLRVHQLDPDNAAASISLVMGVGALVAMLGNPFFGHLSDRTTSRFGMRRPWLVFGAVAGASGLAVVACATSVSELLLGWCATQLAFNAELAALMAILPDQVPHRQRGLVAGAAGMGLPLGMVGGTLLVWALAESTVASFLVPAGIGVATAVCLAWVLPDRRLDGSRVQPRPAVNWNFAALLRDPRYRDFYWAWTSRFLLFMGIAFLLTYQGFYLIHDLGESPSDVPQLIFLSTLVQSAALLVSSIVSGSRSDAVGRRKIFLFAAAMIYALALLVIASASTIGRFLFGRMLTGVGEGMYSAAGNALVADVLPARESDAARNLGFFNIANALPQSLAPTIAPSILIVAEGSYAALFFVASLFTAGAAMTILRIRGVR